MRETEISFFKQTETGDFESLVPFFLVKEKEVGRAEFFKASEMGLTDERIFIVAREDLPEEATHLKANSFSFGHKHKQKPYKIIRIYPQGYYYEVTVAQVEHAEIYGEY